MGLEWQAQREGLGSWEREGKPIMRREEEEEGLEGSDEVGGAEEVGGVV